MSPRGSGQTSERSSSLPAVRVLACHSPPAPPDTLDWKADQNRKTETETKEERMQFWHSWHPRWGKKKASPGLSAATFLALRRSLCCHYSWRALQSVLSWRSVTAAAFLLYSSSNYVSLYSISQAPYKTIKFDGVKKKAGRKLSQLMRGIIPSIYFVFKFDLMCWY